MTVIGERVFSAGWNKLLQLIENDKVETIIMKDMSRLGRDDMKVWHDCKVFTDQCSF